jgi:flagellar export protein FliJ
MYGAIDGFASDSGVLMARFVYRLQKVLEMRERKVKEQEQVVIEAKKFLAVAQQKVVSKQQEIRSAQQSMHAGPHTLLAMHDRFIHRSMQELETLQQECYQAERRVIEEAKRLIQYQAEMEALVKHKDKAYDEWKEEEKRAEMKVLDEVATQRFFRAKLSREIDEALDLATAMEEL